jgi:protein-tyrosine-phosphatase
MAEAFFNHLSKKEKAISAGTAPDKKIHPQTTQIMSEVGIDVSQQKPKLLTESMMKKAYKIIVMDSDILKDIPPKYLQKTESWRIGKLLGKPIEHARKIRNSIKRKVYRIVNAPHLQF